MNKIVFPSKLRMQGPLVSDLQDALQQCLDRRAILPDDEGARREFSLALKKERGEQTYAKATQKLVGLLQEAQRLQITGEVDEPTADALNELLREWGLIDKEYLPAFRLVTGALHREDGVPLRGMRVRAAHQSDRGPIRLGEDTADMEGRYTIRYEALPGVDAINLTAAAIGDDGRMLFSSPVVRNAKILETIDLAMPVIAASVERQTITGTIVLEHGLSAQKLKLRLYRRDYGGKASLLSETTTLSGGRYVFSYDAGSPKASMEVRVVRPDGTEEALSKPLNDMTAETCAHLNLLAPGSLQPIEAEFRRLSAVLTPHVEQMAKLAGAKEDAGQQDITVLNRVTGWDARLIALASITERLASDRDVRDAGLTSETLYGLLRAGLPSDKLLLAQVEPDVVGMAIKKVRDAGIVEIDDAGIADLKKRFTNFANKTRLAIPAPGSLSNYGELLRSSGLPQEAQDKFAPIYLKHRGSGAQLWEEAGKAGLDGAHIGKLKLQGKLAFLAGNSEAMTVRLLNKGLKDPVELAGQDFHSAGVWKNEVFEHVGIPQDRRVNLTEADRKKLEAMIPAAYAGEKIEARLDAYADDMARKVRLSYPTQVLGRLMETDQHFKLATGHDATVKLLKNVTAQGFRLGITPVSSFLKSKSGMQGDLSDAEFQAAGQQLKVMQRMYQITPNNEAMPVLRSLGITSAFDVVAYPEEQFFALFKAKHLEIYKKPAPVGVPELIRSKSDQVTSVTYNLFAIAKKLDSEPHVAGLSAPVQVRESVKNELIKHYPTMESLFGSMDYCECEHCRSVLSPAAYLVDLLQFVDTEPAVWGNFLAQWKATHGNQGYPHKNAAGEAMKPYDVLDERRPDLPHIALSCENTHTALPYIDIVNEILEYYVANGKLERNAARDTGDATTAELLAEPQNVIRGAYDALRTADYPINLPFDLWIETVRRFCDYFETPLHQVLEVFRPKDDLFASTQTFDYAAIFMESLGLSPADVAIFTNPDPLAKWQELYGFATAAEATTKAIDATTGQRIDLNSAKALSRRLGVTYKEITEIVQTEFVNPELSKLRLLYKLRVSIADARFYLANKALLQQTPATLSLEEQKRRLEAEAFSQGLADLARTFKVQVATLEAAIQAIPFGSVLVLADPDAGCNFDLTTLRYSDGMKADPIVFLRINLFVRLWRKLGWSIDETDRAITTFTPRTAPFDGTAVNLTKQPLQTALIYLAHLKSLDEKLRLGKPSRLKMLTLWSDIATIGKKSLYTQLLLKRSVLKTAPVFDHPLGMFLQYFDVVANVYKPFHWDPLQPEDPAAGNVSLRTSVLTLQGALGLTADEIGCILADAGKSLETAELSLPNVSLLYRYGLLAKAVKLTIRELIALRQFSGLDPFKQLHPDQLTTIDQDHPFSQTLEFVKVAEEVKDCGLMIEDLDYLLRHRFEETGKYRPNRESILVLLKVLSEGVRTIKAENAMPDDPGALSDEVLRQKIGLALPADVVATFMAMMNGTAEFAVTRAVASAAQLQPADYAGESSITLSTYDDTKHQQTLVLRGVLFDPEKTDLKTKYGGKLSAGPKGTFEALLDDAQTKAQQEAHEFFDKHLLKQSGNIQPTSGFLDPADYDLLFAPAPAGLTEIQQQARERQKRCRLGQAFLPFVQRRLIRQFIVQTMTAQTGADPVLVESLVADDRLLANPKSLLDAFAATAERGLSTTFWAPADATGTALATVLLADADTSAMDEDGNPLKPAGAQSARLEAYLEVPASGAYRFSIVIDKQYTEAELRFPHLPEPLFLRGAAVAEPDTLGVQQNEFLELKAGVPYRFSLDLKQLGSGDVRLLVQGETLPKGRLSQLTLYPAAAMEAAERATTLLNKALQLVQGLSLSEREIRYLLTHAADFGNLSLSEVPTANVGDSPAEKTATAQRFGRFRRLAAYSRLKRDLAGGTDDLIGIFEANGTSAADRLVKQVYPLIAKLTRREEATIKACAVALVQPAFPAFASERSLSRLWEALRVVERFGVPPASLLGWADIVKSTTTADRRFEVARDLKEAIKARFEPDCWQRVAQPIFDKLRQRQRDALVSHVMQQHGFDRTEQLYEYFLIDPGMEPVVQTSRIRLAISSLQLFIQRCLLNLELKVHPSAINAKQWEWMKRYRVWEANRKIFLFPENWLEPEFRDDKTHLFAELEGALLQGDVSSDLVEDAFLNYLRKLDELARLDIVAMHVEDNIDPALRILHVFGRTYSQPHKYFYRRSSNQMWTPWEPVSAEIEGDHLAPVVWRDRLYLFWVTFLEKAQQQIGDMTIPDLTEGITIAAVKKDVEAQLHWSEYVNGQWTTRESGGFNAPSPVMATGLASFDAMSVFVHVSKEYDPADGAELGVFVHLGGVFKSAFYLAGRNSIPESDTYGAPTATPPGPIPDNKFTSANKPSANRYTGSGVLTISFKEKIITELGKTPQSVPANPNILQLGGRYTVLPCNSSLMPLGVSEDAYRSATNPAAVQAAIQSGLNEIASLMKPVFYQDHRHTFFIEPDLTEQTIEEWQDWVTRTPAPDPGWKKPDWWKELVIIPEKVVPDPKGPLWDPPPIDKDSIIQPRDEQDWLVNSGTAIRFDDGLIGPTGHPGIEIRSSVDPVVSPGLVNISPGSDLADGSTIVLRDEGSFARSGLKAIGGGMNIVGGAGFNSALEKNFTDMNRSGFGAGAPGGGRIGR